MALAFDIFFSNCCLGNGRESSRWLEQIEDDFWISLCIFLVPSCSARHCTAHVFHMPVLSLSLLGSLCTFKLYTTIYQSLSLSTVLLFFYSYLSLFHFRYEPIIMFLHFFIFIFRIYCIHFFLFKNLVTFVHISYANSFCLLATRIPIIYFNYLFFYFI